MYKPDGPPARLSQLLSDITEMESSSELDQTVKPSVLNKQIVDDIEANLQAGNVKKMEKATRGLEKISKAVAKDKVSQTEMKKIKNNNKKVK